MKEIKIGLMGSLNMLEFKNMKENRNEIINRSRPKNIIGEFPINKNAKELHPDYQELIVEKIIEYKDAKSYIFSSNKKVAYFRAGQAISLKLQIGNSFVTRPYSISSSPKEAEAGYYRLTIKRKPNGFVSDYILDTFEVGTKVIASAPFGNFYYEKFRDKQNVVAIAGGSGITPFVSMAHAIEDNIEDFNLTIIYGNNTYDSILFKDELDAIQSNCNKVKVIYVLSNENKEGFESGLITSQIISKYVNEPFTMFVSGSYSMCEYINKEASTMRISQKDIRFDVPDNNIGIDQLFNFPKEEVGKTHKIKVIQGPSTTIIEANSTETILIALERAGIKAPSKCRGGECGWCRSKLLLGNVYTNRKIDKRRYTDKELNYIHPCSTYPIDDCTIEIPLENI